MNEVVIFPESPLLLSEIVRDEQGVIKEAYVVNGAWTLRVSPDGLLQACDTNWGRDWVVNSYQVDWPTKEYAVNPEWDYNLYRHYQTLIELALHDGVFIDGTLPELRKIKHTPACPCCGRPEQIEIVRDYGEGYDDDIPF